ncbi:MAG: YqgE/AlgH family protein [Planctomycetes bacterium]|nr:YqgE/AlgH family protein [Planctomycetota bacterium]
MADSLRGQFLLAGRNLHDPNFLKTVVLIVEHGEDGAMGVVVNRPSGVTVADALKKHFDLPETGEMVYIGGPVERNALFILHNAADVDESETAVIDGIFVGSSPETFEAIVRRAADGDDEIKFRVYFGCAGWGPSQLEGEMSRADWMVCPATPESVFYADPYELWDTLVAEWDKAHSPLPGVPGDFRLN